jgi:molybdenum cofactor guanylyltransferase
MNETVTGIILAGGESKRIKAENKAFLKIGGKRLFDYIYDVMVGLFPEIIIVTNKPLDYLEWNAKIITDIFDERSSLTGVQAGLASIQTDYAFVCSCDAPFLKKAMVELVLSKMSPETDVVVPKVSKGLEPLCALYAKRCVKVMENNLKNKKFAIRASYQSLRVKKIEETVLRQCDPELISFFNINTREDLEAAKKHLVAENLQADAL